MEMHHHSRFMLHLPQSQPAPQPFRLFPIPISRAIFPHREELVTGLDRNRVVSNDVQSLIVIAIAARRMIHRARRIHFIVNDNLF